MNICYEYENFKIYNSDCLEALKELESNSVDSIVSDPPAGISFMNADWDNDKGGRDQWIAWLTKIMKESLRVIKPGGHILIWSLPRTSHWTAMAIEDAGFEIREKIHHIFGSGFPKSMDISKQMDKMVGAEREVLGVDKSKVRVNSEKNHKDGQVGNFGLKAEGTGKITAPATENAKEWKGWGTALKPAVEEWILARKPIEGTNIVSNVLQYGTGAINIDSSRVNSFLPGECEKLAKRAESPRNVIKGGKFHASANVPQDVVASGMTPEGRFPANLILSHSPECTKRGFKKIKGITGTLNGSWRHGKQYSGGYRGANEEELGQQIGYTDKDGMETVEDWDCALDCPIRILNQQSGHLKSCKSTKFHEGYTSSSNTGFIKGVSHPENQYNDEGGAARFFTNFDPDELMDEFVPLFYAAKPSAKEKDAGLKTNRFQTASSIVENNHPTVKNLALMKYLCTLITPPGGVVLDMFMGSGSTGCAAVLCGFKFIGIEIEKDYCELSKKRIVHWSKQM
jgi:DNA modification methylase